MFRCVSGEQNPPLSGGQRDRDLGRGPRRPRRGRGGRRQRRPRLTAQGQVCRHQDLHQADLLPPSHRPC